MCVCVCVTQCVCVCFECLSWIVRSDVYRIALVSCWQAQAVKRIAVALWEDSCWDGSSSTEASSGPPRVDLGLLWGPARWLTSIDPGHPPGRKLIRQVQGSTEASVLLLAKSGEPTLQHSPEPPSHSSEFRRMSPAFTRVSVKVP